jgi:glycosyltransferase involved in cell wall biosynthesis
MTSSSEPSVSDRRPDAPLGERWRAAVAHEQETVLPTGRVVVSCSAPLGIGGLGRHLKEIVEALERREQPHVCICGSDADSPTAARRKRPPRAARAARALTPWRRGAGRGAQEFSAEFDAYAAARLPSADHLIAFNGTSVAQLRAARDGRFESTAVVSATSHVRRVALQHARAHRQYPLEGSWAERLLERNLAEYALADRIYVASEYARESFVEHGFPEASLPHFPLSPDPRYEPDGARSPSGSFDILYVGSLSVAKGVPLLIDAVRGLPHSDIRLLLLGGWKSRGMRRFIQSACAEDPRISFGHGDPYPHLRAARLYVHPSYNDGFAYAPAEALACGVPVIVSEDTGMKDLISRGGNGLVVPTGDLSALTQAIEAAYRAEILVG